MQVAWLVLFVIVGWSVNSEAANEARCAELGANCVCSEPMNTATWANALNGQFFNPADTNPPDLECITSGVIAGAVLEDGSGFRYQAVNSGEAITNLPTGHTNNFVLRTLDNGGGQFISTKFPANAPTARRSIRFYKYYSSNYGWVGGACLNGNKLGQITSQFAGGCAPDAQGHPQCTDGPVITEVEGQFSFYGIEGNNGYNLTANGCCSGPGPGVQAGFDSDETHMRGKWVRYEFVVRNAATTGTPTVWEFYRTIVTPTPGITYKYVDSSVATTFPNGVNWTTALATSLHPTFTLDDFAIDLFRNGTCTGFAAVSHYMAAAWSTDAGQMIGAASEIEGSTIASKYTRDNGICADPAVVFCEPFETAVSTWSARFTGGAPAGLTNSTDVPTASGGTHSAELIPSGTAGQLYTQLPADYVQLWLRVYVKYLGNISHHAGVYLGGYENHSAFPQGDAGIKFGDRFITSFEQMGNQGLGIPNTRMDTYDNFVGMQGPGIGSGCDPSPGGLCFFGRNYLLTEAPPLNIGQWQCVEIRLKPNTTASNQDGELQYWVNDTPIQNFIPGSPVGVYDSAGNWVTGTGSAFPGLQWRDRLTYAVNWIKLQNYSDVGTPYNVRFDDLVVATARIGCLNTGSAGITPPSAPTGVRISSVGTVN